MRRSARAVGGAGGGDIRNRVMVAASFAFSALSAHISVMSGGAQRFKHPYGASGLGPYARAWLLLVDYSAYRFPKRQYRRCLLAGLVTQAELDTVGMPTARECERILDVEDRLVLRPDTRAVLLRAAMAAIGPHGKTRPPLGL